MQTNAGYVQVLYVQCVKCFKRTTKGADGFRTRSKIDAVARAEGFCKVRQLPVVDGPAWYAWHCQRCAKARS